MALRATLQSARDQTHSELEIVVVHEGAPPIDIASFGARGVVDGGKNALWHVVGDLSAPWVRFLPAGDRLAPRTLATELEGLRADPDAAIGFSRVECVDGAGALMGDSGSPPDPGSYGPALLVPEILHRNPWPLGAALGFVMLGIVFVIMAVFYPLARKHLSVS